MSAKWNNTVDSANISNTKVTGINGHTTNTRDTTLRSEVTVTRKMMVLAVIGSVILSTLISVIAGSIVYRVTIDKMADKMADSRKQDQDKAITTLSQNQIDALILTVKELQNNVTTVSDVCNEEIKSLKANVSEIVRNLTAASEEWNEEMMSLKANISELERNLTTAYDACNESIARNYSKDCSELYAAGTIVDGVYTISPDGRYPFHVYCDMTGGGWTLIQNRIDGLVSFNRSWQEYAEGFGNIDGEHWLGLDKIHRLTANGSEIYFHFEYYNGTIGFAHYQAFFVHGANTTYRMNVKYNGYNGTINKKKLCYSDNMMFTTYDRDNDGNSRGNCATDYWYSGGWWFKNCYSLGNLNGVYGRRQKGGIAYKGSGGDVWLKSVNMKVKPSPGHY